MVNSTAQSMPRPQPGNGEQRQGKQGALTARERVRMNKLASRERSFIRTGTSHSHSHDHGNKSNGCTGGLGAATNTPTLSAMETKILSKLMARDRQSRRQSSGLERPSSPGAVDGLELQRCPAGNSRGGDGTGPSGVEKADSAVGDWASSGAGVRGEGRHIGAIGGTGRDRDKWREEERMGAAVVVDDVDDASLLRTLVVSNFGDNPVFLKV